MTVRTTDRAAAHLYMLPEETATIERRQLAKTEELIAHLEAAAPAFPGKLEGTLANLRATAENYRAIIRRSEECAREIIESIANGTCCDECA